MWKELKAAVRVRLNEIQVQVERMEYNLNAMGKEADCEHMSVHMGSTSEQT